MAILGSIRKRPLFLILIIGLAIFAFILADGINSNSGPSRNNIGSVNGEDISSEEFARRVDAQKNTNQKGSSIQNVKTAWDAIVREKIYDEQIEKAGIVVGEKDIWDAMINNPAYQNSPNFKNEAGLFDEDKLKEFIATMKSTPSGNQQWLEIEKNIIASIKNTTYSSLVNAGLTASLKEGKQFYYSENTSADVQYVYEPYTSINNDEVMVSDAEIETYIKNHANDFIVEASREIEYVNFEVKPSKEDIAKVEKELSKLKNDFLEYNKKLKKDENIIGFTNTTDNVGFVNDYSDQSYVDKVYYTTDLANGVYDSISKLTNGSVFGPYLDNDYYKLTKLISSESVKSVKSSHILIAYQGAERAKPTVTRSKEDAKKEAKALLRKVNKNNFVEMAKANSDGPSATKGGDLGGWKKKGSFVKEFEDFIFNNRKGKIDMVETNFGFHLIKIDDIKTEAGLKLANVSIKIDPSEETESNIYQNAETFASDLIDGKDILELAKTKNYAVKKANSLTELSDNITGLTGSQRDIVKWSFEDNTNKGDVKRFDLENSFVIARLTNKYKKGRSSITAAKSKVLPILEKNKKIELIINKMKASNLEEIAKSTGKSIKNANGISIIKPSLNDEAKNVVGALFYMNEGDVKIINGEKGVYAIKVIKKTPLHDIKKYNTYSDRLTTQLKNKNTIIYDALKNASKIDDQRTLFY